MRSIIITIILLGSAAANATSVRYDYSGQEFTSFTDVAEVPGSYIPGMRVSGYFVLSEALTFEPLNVHVIAIEDMLDFSFTDGRNTITAEQLNLPTSIQLSLNANGDIFFWDINLSTSFDQPESGGEQSWQIWTRTDFGGSTATDMGMTSVCIGAVGERPCLGSKDDTAIVFQGAPGTWTATVVPVPAAVWLFGSALAGLGWLRRKQAA